MEEQKEPKTIMLYCAYCYRADFKHTPEQKIECWKQLRFRLEKP